MSQSSNDCFPTAMHIAAADEIARRLDPALAHLQDALQTKTRQFCARSSRSAAPTPRTPRRSRSARNFPATRRRSNAALSASAWRCKELYPLAQGGTAVGTGLNAPSALRQDVRRRVAAITGLPFVSAPNKFEALAVARRLRLRPWRAQCARHRPVQDRQRHPPARLRAALGARRADPAGKRAGLLDHAGQGQSDPGEALTMVCCQVFGNQTTITVGGEPGPFRAQRLQAGAGVRRCCSRSGLLADAARSFTDHCVAGIRADEKRIRELMERSLMLVTALAPDDRLRQGRRPSPRPRTPTARRCARRRSGSVTSPAPSSTDWCGPSG